MHTNLTNRVKLCAKGSNLYEFHSASSSASSQLKANHFIYPLTLPAFMRHLHCQCARRCLASLYVTSTSPSSCRRHLVDLWLLLSLTRTWFKSLSLRIQTVFGAVEGGVLVVELVVISGAMSSAAPLMARFAELQPEEGAAAALVAPEASSEAGRKGLEDGVAGNEKLVSMADVSKHKSQGDAWVVVDGVVYDISLFVDTHPGGVEVILEHLHWRDVGKLMRGEEGDSPASHSHSSHAFRMLQQFRIGRVTDLRSDEDEATDRRGSQENRNAVDLNKPLVFQVGKLGADYDRWVHDPIVQKEPPRFFESDAAEFITRTAWWIIPAVWVPVVIKIAMAAYKQGVWLSATPFTMAAGAFIWTFVEYLLHRYVFHMKTSGYWSNTAHYFLHGFHHKHPMDGTRLVFPPAITAIIVCILWYITEPIGWIVTPPVKMSMFSGGLLAYVAYDLTHYFLHFGTPYNETSRMMKRFHLNHHFREQSSSYGVTTSFWDTVFGTFPQPAK